MSGTEVICFATQGTDSNDEGRIVELLAELEPTLLPFDHSEKRRSAWNLTLQLLRRKPDLVVMEGTGVAGGIAVLAARLTRGIPYIVSSGDAIGPYLGARNPRLRPVVHLYERALCRLSAGYIGWTPYLTGRALTLGAPRAMTAANWAVRDGTDRRAEIRERLGLPDGAIAFGIAGSLEWNDRAGYCYGYELARAIAQTDREDVRAVIVGDGTGRERLERLAAQDRQGRILMVGLVPREEVPAYLSALDVASLPQSVDQVGSFRYTTKLSEYLAARVPVVTGQIPLAYDLDDGWLWRLPGETPWGQAYVDALAELMATVSAADIEQRRQSLPEELGLFSAERQKRQVTAFVRDILASRATKT